jgi:hypothetical protein
MSCDFYTSAFHPKALKYVCLMWQVFWLGLTEHLPVFTDSGMKIQQVNGAL